MSHPRLRLIGQRADQPKQGPTTPEQIASQQIASQYIAGQTDMPTRLSGSGLDVGLRRLPPSESRRPAS